MSTATLDKPVTQNAKTQQDMDALNAACLKARKEVGDATGRLGQVLAELEDAMKRQLKAECQMSIDEAGTLIDYAAKNESRWSGGVRSVTNIVEHTYRGVAIELLKNINRQKNHSI